MSISQVQHRNLYGIFVFLIAASTVATIWNIRQENIRRKTELADRAEEREFRRIMMDKHRRENPII